MATVASVDRENDIQGSETYIFSSYLDLFCYYLLIFVVTFNITVSSHIRRQIFFFILSDWFVPYKFIIYSWMARSIPKISKVCFCIDLLFSIETFWLFKRIPIERGGGKANKFFSKCPSILLIVMVTGLVTVWLKRIQKTKTLLHLKLYWMKYLQCLIKNFTIF